jgi:DUF2075 family protein/DNA replication protein DnaC
MLIYNGTKSVFLANMFDQKMTDLLTDTIYKKMHRKSSKSEIQSWDNSLKNMFMVLSDTGIPDDAGVAIEYNIPQTSKRVDFIVSGYDSDKKENAIVIELKQWEKVVPIKGMDALVETYTGGALRRVVHPSYQAWSYAAMIEDYNATVQNDDIGIKPCAYLHNYEVKEKDDPLLEEQYQTYIEESPVFTKKDARKLADFIKRYVHSGDDGKVIYKIDAGKIRPSKSLQDSIASMVKGNKEFTMIDDQKVVYEEIIDLSKKSFDDHKKRVIIVKGGPGTGKTVVAVNLLAELTNRGQLVQYVTRNSAPRNVYKAKLKGEVRKNSIDNLFQNAWNYVNAPKNSIHTLLVDEAHRLTEKSGRFSNLGENEIKEIINAAYCSVFFIDESQRVTLKDIGSVQEIKKWANLANAEVYETELVSQFRCNGSDGYVAWIDNVLGIRETANFDMEGIDYDFRICDTPFEMQTLIKDKNRLHNRARILAGYCWEWPKEERNNKDYHDIKIGDFEMSWNMGEGIWAIDKDSLNEAGCIHTSQGLEFDYVGVIIGEDMRVSGDKVITDFTKRASTDQSMKGIKSYAKKDPKYAKEISDEIIKNTYRTLMTRGMKGCYVYCCDKKLAEYFKIRIGRKS